MNQSELVSAVAAVANLTKADATKAVDAITHTIAAALNAGDDVRLTGFDTFSVTTRDAHQGRNPRTGEAIDIAASKAPKFSIGKGLKDALNP